MKIQVDNREDKRRIDSFVKYFTDMNYNHKSTVYTKDDVTVSVETIPIGDYVFDNRVCFEYKTSDDIIGSIIDKRVFKQVKRMQHYPYHYIVIVGNVVASINKRNQKNFTQRKFTVKQYIGALARLSIDGKVIHVDNRQQAWYLMDRILSKVDKNVEVVDTPKINLENPIATFLTCIPVNNDKLLSKNKALLICNELDLHKLSDLFKVSYKDLIDIKGIGVKTACSIVEAIG